MNDSSKKSLSIFKCGSDLPQLSIVRSYAKALSMDKDHRYFDDRVEAMLLKYARDKSLIDGVSAHARSINYTTSKYEYNQIEEQIKRFESGDHPYFGWNRNYKRAKEYMLNEVRGIHLSSLMYNGNDDIMDSLPKKGTHAGSDYLVTGKRTKGEYEEEVFKLCLKSEKEAKVNKTFGMPIMIGTRTQATSPYEDGVFTGVYKNKTRLVSMIALRQIVTEMRWSKPIQGWMSNQSWYAGGKNDNQINSLLNGMRSRTHHWISIDYSKYDQSISSWLIYDAFEILESMFLKDKNHDSELYWIMVKDLCKKRFIDGNGKLRFSEKGVPSGSMFTQIIDSVVNRLIVLTYFYARGRDILNDNNMMIMGDDNIIFSRERLDMDDLAGYISKNFGIEVSAEKSLIGDEYVDPEFLSRQWSYGGAYRQVEELILSLLYPERYRNYFDEKVFPELVLYSYMLAYPLTMRDLIDTRRFEEDYPNLRNKIAEVGVAGLTGSAHYYFNYVLKGLS